MMAGMFLGHGLLMNHGDRHKKDPGHQTMMQRDQDQKRGAETSSGSVPDEEKNTSLPLTSEEGKESEFQQCAKC